MNKTCYVYKHYGHNKTLLYVGMTSNLRRRTETHARSSPWYKDVVETKITGYETRAEALNEETKSIQTEYPKHNVRHSPGFVDFNNEEVQPLNNVHFRADALREWVLANPDASFMHVPCHLVIPSTAETLKNGLRD